MVRRSAVVSPFRLLVAGRVVSLLGSSMTPVALAFAVLGATGRPTDLASCWPARSFRSRPCS